MGFILPLIQAGASIFGSIANSRAQDKANDRAAADSALNRQLQLDTLKNQIQWKVQDAIKAGISPLAALGSMPYSYSPVSSNFQPVQNDWASVGQDITRAIQAGGSNRQRIIDAKMAAEQAVVQHKADNLQLENMQLNNDLLRSQIGRLNSAQLGPGVPEFRDESSPPGIPPGSVLDQPSSVVVGSVGEAARQPGMLTDYQFAHTSRGFAVVPGSDMKQRVEDMPSEWQWFLRNGISPPREVYNSLTRQHPPRPGYQWVYNALTGEFTQERADSRGRELYEFFFRPDLWMGRQ